MTKRPTGAELVEAVIAFLQDELLPMVDDQRLRFRTLVAINGLEIVCRELSAVPDNPSDARRAAERQRLARAIRRGEIADGTFERVKQDVEEQLRIASPKHLNRYRGENHS